MIFNAYGSSASHLGARRLRALAVTSTQRLDAAPLGWFTFKGRFQPLRPDQRLAMFVREALGDARTNAPADVQSRLAALDQLCLGDFAAVRRHADILLGVEVIPLTTH